MALRTGEVAAGSRAGGASVDLRYQVPTWPIPRLHYPTEINAERFNREFAAQSRPCIVSGLLEDWPAHADTARTWRGDRWDQHFAETLVDLSFDPKDNRIMHFGDDEGQPGTMFNPGRLKVPVWAFLEVGRLRAAILRARQSRPEAAFRLDEHPGLRQRLDRELTVQNTPFVTMDEHCPLHYFQPLRCRVRDLLPLAFYLSCDTFALPRALQTDLSPLATKLCPAWGTADSSRVWVSSGGNWSVPYPPWGADSVPEPCEDQSVYSCFHCDRMENLHSVLAGEKEVVLVPPGQRDVLKATRYSRQSQWLLAPVAGGGQQYLGSTAMSSQIVMDFQSDQSAVHPLRSAEDNRRVSGGAWPDQVDFPVSVGRLRKGDTLYIPAYHWHWVATTTPPVLGRCEEGPLALSVNFWWWPMHNDAAMERWSFQNEVESWENRRVTVAACDGPQERNMHAASFYRLTATKRMEAAQWQPWPRLASEDFEPVD